MKRSPDVSKKAQATPPATREKDPGATKTPPEKLHGATGPAAELRRLVHEQCARFGERDVGRFLRDALADPEGALTAYRLLASQTIH